MNNIINNFPAALAAEVRGRRAIVRLRNEQCAACEFLALCHGGCPVRAYTARGDFFRNDPYCEFYNSLFEIAQEKAALLTK